MNSELFTSPPVKPLKSTPESPDLEKKKMLRRPSFVERKLNPFKQSPEKSSLTSSISTTFLPTSHRMTFSALSSSSSTIGLPSVSLGSFDKTSQILEVEVLEVKKGEKFVYFDPNSSNLPSAVVHLTSQIRDSGLNTAGIFRISGIQSNVLALKKTLDAGKYPSLDEYEIHDVCSTLKLWLRQMNQPLLTFALYEPFMAATSVTESDEERIECIRKVVEELPVGHYALLKYLVEFLLEITEKSELNLMTSSNLAIVFTPTCLRPQNESIDVLFGNSTNSNSLFESFITDYKDIFLPRDKTKKVALTTPQAQFVCGSISRATFAKREVNQDHHVPSWDNFFSNPNTTTTQTPTSNAGNQKLSSLYSMVDELDPQVPQPEESEESSCTESITANAT